MQLVAVPGLFTVTALFGAISANMTMVIPRYGGVATFQPFDVIEKGGWLESHGGRAAAFFCSAAWALGSMTTNISENPSSSFVVPPPFADAPCHFHSCQQCIEC